jgi:hypothetical protein
MENRLLHEDEYCVIRLEPHARLLTFVRKPMRLPDLDASKRFFKTLAYLNQGNADRLLTDLREAPPNNDPEWEAAFSQQAERIFSRFRKRATVVRSQVGKLQVERVARRGNSEKTFRVFHDDVEARRWLLE